MTTITVQLKNIDQATAQAVANFILRTLEKEGLKSNIVNAEIESDEVVAEPEAQREETQWET